MLVKYNLIVDSYLRNPQYWQSYKNFKKDGAIVTAIYDNPGALGLIFKTNKPLKGDVNYTLSIYVKGTNSFQLNYNYFMDKENGNYSLNYSSLEYPPHIWQRITIPFKHNENYSYENIMVGFNRFVSGNMAISFKYPKLEEGTESTIYTPNPEEFDKERQEIFPPEGEYKEIQAI